MNPASPRRGIKLATDSLYYCEEVLPYIGKYKYYARKFDKDSFYVFKAKAEDLFGNIGFTESDIADATVYAITIRNDKKLKFRKEFIYEYLDKDRFDFTLKLEKLFYGKLSTSANSAIIDGLLINIPQEPPLPPDLSSSGCIR